MTETETVPTWLLEIVRCPVTGSPLHADVAEDGTPVLVGDAEPHLVYTVTGGVPVLLAPA